MDTQTARIKELQALYNINSQELAAATFIITTLMIVGLPVDPTQLPKIFAFIGAAIEQELKNLNEKPS